VERREGAKENTDKPARAGLRAGQACPLDWTVYGHFAVKHPRWEPDAGMPHVRFCAGGAQ
jgi:hypothetical protein